MIILSLLTFTDMANVFANSIGLRGAFYSVAAGEREASTTSLRGYLERYPASIGRYDFRPNVDRFVLYSFIGLVIVFLINKIEGKGDSTSKENNLTDGRKKVE